MKTEVRVDRIDEASKGGEQHQPVQAKPMIRKLRWRQGDAGRVVVGAVDGEARPAPAPSACARSSTPAAAPWSALRPSPARHVRVDDPGD